MTVESVVIGVVKSCNLSLTETAKAAFSKLVLILLAISKPETPSFSSNILPSGNLILTILSTFSLLKSSL